MAADQYKRDAEFFTAMWESLRAEASPDATFDERRDSTRFPFSTVQLAVSLDGDDVPPIEEFEPIRCHDISRGGISYYTKHEPMSKKVVLVIETADVRYCIESNVVYSRPVYKNGDIQHLVGCQFTRRVDL